MALAARCEAPGKRSVNLSIRAELADAAEAFGMNNKTALMESALAASQGDLRRQKWRDVLVSFGV